MTMKPLKSQLANSIKFEKTINGGDSVLLTGFPCCGKTTLATSVLRKNGHLYALMDCNYFKNLSQFYIDILECFNHSLEVEQVQNKIPGHNLSSLNFLALYKEYYECVLDELNGDKLYLILDDVEVLVRYSMFDTLVALSNIETLCLILIANQTPIQLFTNMVDPSARKQLIDKLDVIYMVPFTKEETYELVIKDMPRKFQEIYYKFANYTVSLLYLNHTNNLMEIKSFCQESFPSFLKFFNEEVDRLMYIYDPEKCDRDGLMEESSTQSKAVIKFFESFKKVSRSVDVHTWHKASGDSPVTLGVSILIISALIAAYTRPSADKINFVKLQKKGRKPLLRAPVSISREFTMERLIHIYRGLSNLLNPILSVKVSQTNSTTEQEAPVQHEVEKRCESSDTLMSDILILESRNIIYTSTRNNLDSTNKFKISPNLPPSFYRRISNQINLNLEEIHGLPREITTKTY